ncbi:MAG: class I SAM-dependent methyltransferase [Planctomycetota bacterium]
MNSRIDTVDDVRLYNRQAWNKLVRKNNRWTVPVSPETTDRAREDDWQIILTPEKPVPRDWFPDFRTDHVHVLCLAGSGGQQAPILAAAGADVTVLDNSPAQLAQDQFVADRDGLSLRLIEGDMADLAMLQNETFDLIVHPCSNCFAPNVLPVWREAARVLKPGGSLLSGFVQSHVFLFDDDLMDEGQFELCHQIPYSDLGSLPDDRRRALIESNEPVCFGHTMADQIGGQIDAGLAITGFYEDGWSDWPICKYISAFAATKATKLE